MALGVDMVHLALKSRQSAKGLRIQNLQEHRCPPTFRRIGPTMACQATRQGFDHQAQAISFVARIHATQRQDGARRFLKQDRGVTAAVAMAVHDPGRRQMSPFFVNAVGHAVCRGRS
jgi:hypothetical protein